MMMHACLGVIISVCFVTCALIDLLFPVYRLFELYNTTNSRINAVLFVRRGILLKQRVIRINNAVYSLLVVSFVTFTILTAR